MTIFGSTFEHLYLYLYLRKTLIFGSTFQPSRQRRQLPAEEEEINAQFLQGEILGILPGKILGILQGEILQGEILEGEILDSFQIL